VVTNSTGRVASAIPEHWEGLINSTETSRNQLVPTGSVLLTQSRLDAETPARPNHDHHLTALPPTTPTEPTQIEIESTGSQVVATTMLEQVPPLLPTVAETADTPSFNLPSEAQIARLNSRSGRPSSQLLSDPSRRRSGIFLQSNLGTHNPQFSVPPNQDTINSRLTMTGEYGHVYGPPKAPMGAFGQTIRPHVEYASNLNMASDFSRRTGQGHIRQSSGGGTYRPRMARLETIHSVVSQPDSQTLPNARLPGVARQPSRAERSAAINIQEAKRRGWRGTTKKKKRNDMDGASSAGWTDVSRDSFGPEQKQGKGTKCEIM